MDKLTSDALEASIKHWEENVAAKAPEDAKIFSDSCALCAIYNNIAIDKGCIGCPVEAVTRRPECGGSPWGRAFRAKIVWYHSQRSEAAKSDWRIAAQAELDFLISLREPQSS